jgi:hypothetical protein
VPSGACWPEAIEDQEALESIFESDGRDLIASTDSVADRSKFANFCRRCTERWGEKQLYPLKTAIGFTLPVVKKNAGWYFDLKKGKYRISNRYIAYTSFHFEIYHG